VLAASREGSKGWGLGVGSAGKERVSFQNCEREVLCKNDDVLKFYLLYVEISFSLRV
jgi:hypothetical protein